MNKRRKEIEKRRALINGLNDLQNELFEQYIFEKGNNQFDRKFSFMNKQMYIESFLLDKHLGKRG